MKDRRLRTKIFQVWLHPKEYQFLTAYAEENMITASETVRGWIHEVMKRDGYEINEPTLPENKSRRSK